MPASTPSISTDMNFAAEMPRAADWLVDHVRGIVLDAGQWQTWPNPPCE